MMARFQLLNDPAALEVDASRSLCSAELQVRQWICQEQKPNPDFLTLLCKPISEQFLH